LHGHHLVVLLAQRRGNALLIASHVDKNLLLEVFLWVPPARSVAAPLRPDRLKTRMEYACWRAC
jgi:hypothetical protein